MQQVNLGTFDNRWFTPRAPRIKTILWYYTCALVFQSHLFPVLGPTVFLFRLFGAKVAKAVWIKPWVNIKYPWLLEIGDHCWIGENSWINNLTHVKIGNSVCVSQGAMLLTGNHNYKSSPFDLSAEPITLEDGVWIGARSVVCPGATCGSHSVLSVSSVTSKDLEPYTISMRNPAVPLRKRMICKTTSAAQGEQSHS